MKYSVVYELCAIKNTLAYLMPECYNAIHFLITEN